MTLRLRCPPPKGGFAWRPELTFCYQAKRYTFTIGEVSQREAENWAAAVDQTLMRMSQGCLRVRRTPPLPPRRPRRLPTILPPDELQALFAAFTHPKFSCPVPERRS